MDFGGPMPWKPLMFARFLGYGVFWSFYDIEALIASAKLEELAVLRGIAFGKFGFRSVLSSSGGRIGLLKRLLHCR